MRQINAPSMSKWVDPVVAKQAKHIKVTSEATSSIDESNNSVCFNFRKLLSTDKNSNIPCYTFNGPTKYYY